VLFITHDASRTGAPIVLLHLLRAVVRADVIDVVVAAGSGGPLLAEFTQLAPTVVLSAPRAVRAVGRRVRGGASATRQLERALAKRRIGRLGRFDLVYSNTVMNTELLALVGSAPVITHVHELEQWIAAKVTPEKMDTLVARTDHFIVASEPVRRNLCDRHGADPARVTVVEEFIDLDAVPARAGPSSDVAGGSVHIGGAGTLDRRKGADLFIRAAAAIRAASTVDIRFTWIGGDLEAAFAREVRALAAELGIADHVVFTGHVGDALRRLAQLDLFLLTSREDPFPLVMLEAAALRLPIVCFDGTGGAPGFVEDDAGSVVAHLDTAALAQAALGLIDDPARMRRAGDRAREKVERRSDVKVAAPRILALIEATCADADGQRA
jgi:glycosyltransferase involved in cell wall biosynthesis